VLQGIARLGSRAKEIKVVMFSKGDPLMDPDAVAMRGLADALGIGSCLDMRPGVPHREMPDILRSCDVGLIAYGRDLGVDSLPNRLFEYLALGLPVIAPVYAVEIAKILEEEGCGLLADFEDPESISKALETLLADPDLCRTMGVRGRQGFLERHNWEKEIEPLLAFIHQREGQLVSG
jgi:glycosyltransferase involved in cell wall biosynthesis